jgi:hypothetical protein
MSQTGRHGGHQPSAEGPAEGLRRSAAEIFDPVLSGGLRAVGPIGCAVSGY